MIAGIPGTGKSAFVMWWVAQMNLRTLYFSADMAPHTATARLVAIQTGDPVSKIKQERIDETPLADFYADSVSTSNIQFCFDANPRLEDIGIELDAYVEVWDCYPEVIVIDNLLNVEGSFDMQGQSGILSELHRCARVTGAAIIVLHHASEAGLKSPFEPTAREKVQNKVTQYPEITMTVAYNNQTDEFGIAVVKNRDGQSDASASTVHRLHADLGRCWFDRPRQRAPEGSWVPEGWGSE